MEPIFRYILTLALITLNITVIAILHNSFAFTTNASSWFINTFLSTQHPADHQSINFFSWLNYFFTAWLVIPFFLMHLFSCPLF